MAKKNDPQQPAPRAGRSATYKIYVDQANGLAIAATMRRGDGKGRPDHSRILREILDTVADGKLVDEDIRDALRMTRGATLEP